MSDVVSRRGFFSAFAKTFQKKAAAAPPVEPTAVAESATPRTAIIQGRFCIALTSFCATCVERCPVPGAMSRDRGLPMVNPDVCTGCGICHDVCPAPRKAVLMLPRRTSTPPPTA
ncbi:4Fe-4S binding protein [Prosthecobacter sp.]|uniref:4Fe-4S binding protein n=1 Tax=Prosthecobacter sp. TaxID=1965333 RepID=UPI002ABBE769|nr:4Fe-4S binding protein [Prosthecobacter sp.]MDZ4402518.1 4Fe-4S binding protein [Prosthecobacter sp.]